MAYKTTHMGAPFPNIRKATFVPNMARCSCGFLSTMVLTLKLIRSLYTVQGFECQVGMVATSLTDSNTHSVNFTWNCTLRSNESVLSVLWSKEDTCIAKAYRRVLTPCPTYVGRVEMFGTFGISLHNISRNDSGHYRIVILLDGNIKECFRCPSVYMLVLMEHHHKANAQPMDGGLSKLNILLICGIVSITIIGFALGLFYFYRSSGAGQTGNENKYPDQIGILQRTIQSE